MNRASFLRRIEALEQAAAAKGGSVSSRRIEWARRLYRDQIHTERFLHVLTEPYNPRVVAEFRLDQVLLRQPADDLVMIPIEIDDDPGREAIPTTGGLRLTARDPRQCVDPYDDDALPQLMLFQKRGDPIETPDLAGLPDGLYLRGKEALKVEGGVIRRRTFGKSWRRVRTPSSGDPTT